MYLKIVCWARVRVLLVDVTQPFPGNCSVEKNTVFLTLFFCENTFFLSNPKKSGWFTRYIYIYLFLLFTSSFFIYVLCRFQCDARFGFHPSQAKISACWPSKGHLVFENVQLRYRPQLPLAPSKQLDIAGCPAMGLEDVYR